MIPFPQIAPVKVQLFSQPSPFTKFPSSQASPASMIPFPQIALTELLEKYFWSVKSDSSFSTDLKPFMIVFLFEIKLALIIKGTEVTLLI